MQQSAVVPYRNVRLAMVYAASFLACLGGPARACFEIDTPPGPSIWFTSATTAQVSLRDVQVKSGGIAASDFCAVGLAHSGSVITGVTAVTVLDDDEPSGTPLPGLSFSPNTTTTADFAAAHSSPAWSGFYSGVSAPIPGSTLAAITFSITVASGTTYADIIAELQDGGFLGVDDANNVGQLLGTSQSIDGIVGVRDLPECYDNLLQAGEFCDLYSNLGCSSGDICLECSVCAQPGPANRCKSRILSDLARFSKRELTCYAKGARQGSAVDPACLAAVNTLGILNVVVPFKYTPSCPQTLPSAATLHGRITTYTGDLANALPLGSGSGAWKCAAAKFKAAAFRAVGLLKCHSKGYAIGAPVSWTCLTKVDTKYTAKITKAELPGQCDPGNVGNGTAVAVLADDFVSDLLGLIPP